MKKNAVLGVGCLTLAIACGGSRYGEDHGSSDLKIAGGLPALRKEFPSVVKLIVDEGTETTDPKICTGVIISHRTILAAAHCIQAKTDGVQVSYEAISVEKSGTRLKNEIRAKRVYSFSQGLSKENIMSDKVVLDLAVLDFGPKAFALKQYPLISQSAPRVGDKVTLVGFGATNFDETSENVIGNLNTGTNTIREYDPQTGYLKLTGTIHSDGSTTGALAGPGDSGGPLFNANGDIIGIGSGFKIEGNTVTNLYADLTADETKLLLGNYLQKLTPSENDLVAGFTPQTRGDSPNTSARSSGGAAEIFEVKAMCGGGKKKNRNRRKNRRGNGGKAESAQP